MANILDTIIATKFEEIKESQKIKSLDQLKDEVKSASQPRGFVKAIETQLSKNKAAVIAEIKKASPSKGVIRILILKRLLFLMKKVGRLVCQYSQIKSIFKGMLII